MRELSPPAHELAKAELLDAAVLERGIRRSIIPSSDAVLWAERRLQNGDEEPLVLELASLMESEYGEALRLLQRMPSGSSDPDAPWILLGLRAALEEERRDKQLELFDRIYVDFDYRDDLSGLGFYNANPHRVTVDELYTRKRDAAWRIVGDLERALLGAGPPNPRSMND